MATPNPFDEFDGANPFDAFDAGEKKPDRTRAAITAATGLVRGLSDHLQASLDTIGGEPASGPPQRNRGAPQLAEVVVNAPRVKEPGWRELAGEIPTQIGAQTVKRVAGAREYVGDTRNAAAKKELWQTIFLPAAVRESKARGIALTEHPDVLEQSRRLGIRPDVFARDWPKYANLSSDELVAKQTSARERIASSEEQRQAGASLRREASQVAQAYRPDLKEWSPKSLVFDAAVSIPDLLIAAGAGTAGGPVAGVGALMAGVAPGFYAEGKEMGLEGPRAETYAALMTLAEGVPEIPVVRAITRTPAAKAAIRESVGKLIVRATGRAAQVPLLEGVSESVTESLQLGIEHGLLEKNTPLPEALNRIARAGVVGVAMGAGVKGVTAAGEAVGVAARRAGERPRPGGLTPDEFVTETESIYGEPQEEGGQIGVEDARGASQAQPETPGYTVAETPLDEAQRQDFARSRSGVQAEENLLATVAGGRPSREWTEAARGAGASDARQPFYRGGRGPLTAEKFTRETLGQATAHPTAGLGVFFSNRREDAARFGEHVEQVYLDLRNPKTIKAEELPAFDSTDDAFAWREQIRKQGHDGLIIDASHLDGPVWPVAFTPEQVIREQTANPFDQFDTERQAAGVQAMAGTQYVGMLQGQTIPQQPTVTIAPGTSLARDVVIPEKPVRREHIMREFQRLFGVKVYQGLPFKVRKALGFFRPKTGEVRVRKWNDLEVTAHEVFHWLDRNYPSIRKLYHEKRFSDELKGVSYDQKLLFEGFAEFGRLFLTQAAQAAAKTPNFYQAFITEAENAGILDKLLTVQTRMHQWYLQGAEGRARSKIGATPPTLGLRWHQVTDRLLDRTIQQTLDFLQGFKIVERDINGELRDATVSPYKSARLVAGARSVAKAILNRGTVAWHTSGDIVFTGKGLKQIFDPVADVLDDAMAYFVGRRAAELASQGRENLFERDEINALVNVAARSPKGQEIKRAFDEYQAFLDRMLNFYEQSGLISRRTRVLMREMNRDYVPFHRIVETLEHGETGKPAGSFRRLKGGTQNVRDVFQNITLSVQALAAAALHNHTKQQLYSLIESSPNGARYAVRVATEPHAARIDPNWLIRKVNELIDDNALAKAAVEAMAEHPGFGETMLFWSGRYAPTAPDLDVVLVNGEPRYFQIGDPILMETLQQFNTLKPIGLALRMLGGAANVLRRGVTLALDFQIPNLIRDSFNAFTLSKGRQFPMVDSIRGMVARLRNDPDYWDFLANGGGFSSQIHGETQALRTRLERYYTARHIDYRTVLDTPQKLLDSYDELASAFEYGTRLAEFKKLRGRGASRREAAFQGREISTDFAMRGASDFLRVFTVSVPFLNARIQGLYRVAREVFERDGRVAFNAGQTKRFVFRALVGITIPSIALWWLYHDEERYKSLPEWVKLTNWVILGPGDKVFLIPKPFEVGAMFGTVPEQALESWGGEGGKFAEAMGFLAANTFHMDPTPQAVKPLVDIASNRAWSGAPIVSESLRDVAPAEQFTPFTSETMVRLGRQLDMSPAQLDYLMRGYFGTLGLYALSATDALLDPSLETGPKPAGRFGEEYVIRRFVRSSPYHGTAQEEEFYKVLEATREAVATLRKIERDQRFSEVEKYLADPEKRTLLAISGQSIRGQGAGQGAEQIAKRASEINSLMNKVRLSPKLTAEQKRDELNKLQQEKNALFDAASTVFSRAHIESLIDLGE